MVAVRIAWVLFTVTFAFIGGVFGYAVSVYYRTWKPIMELIGNDQRIVLMSTVAFVLLGALLGFILAAFFYRKVVIVAADLQRISFADKVAGILGVVLGLGVSALIAFQFNSLLRARVPAFALTVPFLATIVCVYLGVALTMSMKEELANALSPGPTAEVAAVPEVLGPTPKFLDTNVIIDGRMADLCKTGFLEGPIYIPAFVLNELQQIADSEDSLRRARGRRGLDVLGRMQKETDTPVEVFDDYGRELDRIAQVDSKLVRLARENQGALVTNDFNLNKVAELQGVPVLNINELANALKPVVLPGEELRVTIVKEGKENRQGVAYLDDGTMVVVEEAQSRIGETISTLVTSVLQTVAGKMIFAEVAPSAPRGRPIPHAQPGDDLFGDNNSDSSGGGQRRTGGRPRRR